jgi:glucosamine 6-phosphate synthetase-like amidotransferase/phosphosugar isomerase protein
MTIFTYGSPILVAFGDEEIFVASETTAFQNHTKEYFST